jgi:hypothetical protein
MAACVSAGIDPVPNFPQSPSHGFAQKVEGCDAAKFERCLGAAEEHSRPRVGTTGTAGPRNLIPVISLNGDVQVLARSVVVLVRTICRGVADLGPIGGVAEARTVHCQVSVTGVKKVEEFAACLCARPRAGFRTGSNSATSRRTVPARVLVRRAVLHRNASPEAQPGALRGTARA